MALSIIATEGQLRAKMLEVTCASRVAVRVIELQAIRKTIGSYEKFCPAMFRAFASNISLGKAYGQSMQDAANDSYAGLVDYIIPPAERSYWSTEENFEEKKVVLGDLCDALTCDLNISLAIAQTVLTMKSPSLAWSKSNANKFLEDSETRQTCNKGKTCTDEGCIKLHKCRFGKRCHNGANCKWFHDATLDFTSKRRAAKKQLALEPAAAAPATPAAAATPSNQGKFCSRKCPGFDGAHHHPN